MGRTVACALLLALSFAGCGGDDDDDGQTTCERAQSILEGCGITGNQFPTCEGNDLTYAECTVDHESEVCDGLADGSNLTNGFNECVSHLSAP